MSAAHTAEQAQGATQAHTVRHTAPDGSCQYDEVIAGGETVGFVHTAINFEGRPVIVAKTRGAVVLGQFANTRDAIVAVLEAA